MSEENETAPGRGFARVRLVHAAACLISAAAYLAIVFAQEWNTYTFAPFLKLHTAENFLRAILQREHASESLSQSFDALPPGSLAVLHGKSSIDAELIAYLVNYLAWPRPVRLIPVEPGSGLPKEILKEEAWAGVYFCQIDPPPDARQVIRFGKGLVLVPRSAPQSESP